MVKCKLVSPNGQWQGNFSQAELAVFHDNNNGTFKEKNYSQNPWVQIDLGEMMPVTRVEIVARDRYDGRLNGSTIFLSKEAIGGTIDVNVLRQMPNVTEIGQISGQTFRGNTKYFNMYAAEPMWYTDDTTPTVKGTISRPLATGERLILTNSNGESLDEVSVDGTNWTSTLTQALPLGMQNLYLKVIKANGEIQPLSTTQIEIAIPSNAEITLDVQDDFGVKQDISIEGQLRDDATPILTGKLTKALAPGEEIKVYQGDQFMGYATVSYSGGGDAIWQYQVANLNAGIHRFKAEIYNRYTAQILDKAEGSYRYLDIDNSSLWIEGDPASVFDNVKLSSASSIIAKGRLSTPLGENQRIAVYVGNDFYAVAQLAGDQVSWQATLNTISSGTHAVKWRLETQQGENWVAETAFRETKISLTDESLTTQREVNAAELHNGVLFSGRVAPNQSLILQWGNKASKAIQADGQGRWSVSFYDLDSFFGKQGPIEQQGITQAVLKSGDQVLGQIPVLLDTIHPEIISITADQTELSGENSAGSTTTVTFTFSEDLGDRFSLENVQVRGGTLSNLAGEGSTRTATFTADQSAVPEKALIFVARESFTDKVGNANKNQSTLALNIGNNTVPEPITSHLEFRAGSTVNLDLRDPTFVLTSNTWRVKISGMPDSVSLSVGVKQSDGSWLVNGTDLAVLKLISTKQDKGSYLLTATYQQQQEGNWQDISKASIDTYIAPWITTLGRVEDINNFTHYLDAWNDGIAGLSGKGIRISTHESTGNLPLGDRFDKANVAEGTSLPTDHSREVMQYIGGIMNGEFTGVAYDSRLSWQSPTSDQADIINMSVVSNYIDGTEWYKNSVETGRNGLGTIWTVSASNKRRDGTNTAITESTKSPTMIAVASIDRSSGEIRYFSSPGEAIHIASPGNDGTSFSAPAVAGAIGLMLQANEQLGFRDVQQIIAHTATYHPKNNPFKLFSLNKGKSLNGAGMHFSSDVGFGIIDVYGSVLLGRDWLRGGYEASVFKDVKNAPNQPASWWKRTSEVDKTVKTLSRSANTKTSFTFEMTDDVTLEAVQARINIKDQAFRNLKIVMVSPEGTESIIANGTKDSAINGDLSMMTKRFWGENAKGTWTISFEHKVDVSVDTTIKNVQLSFFGTGDVVDDRYVYTDEFVKTFDNLADEATQAKMLTLNDTNGGNDSILASAMRTDVVVNLNNANTSAYMNILGKTVTISDETQIENVFAGLGNDTLVGNSQYTSFLVGNAGNDKIISLKEGSRLEGGDGDDWLMFNVGDQVTGGTGSDSFIIDTDPTGFTNLAAMRSTLLDFDKAQDKLYGWNNQTLKVAEIDSDDQITWSDVREQSIIDQALTLKEFKYPTQNHLIIQPFYKEEVNIV
ncbi:S8 family serine peptidase [Gallibacterium trehalosifermentans]|uniref:S8 family serine peptidase n=1 Tax=Gallibacterium trehalosifermentans TaxID=516935 RepID=A0ABV6H2S0_9PAST